MGGRHQRALPVGQEHRQAVGHHDGAGQPWRAGHGGVGGGSVGAVGHQRQRVRAVHLVQEHRPRADGRAQAGAVGGHRRRRVAHVIAQIEVRPGRCRGAVGGAASAPGEAGPHARGRRPVGHQPVAVDRGMAGGHQASASGQAEGCACWKASSFMQASNTAMVRGKPFRSQSKRWALKICGTRQQSASVGASPWL